MDGWNELERRNMGYGMATMTVALLGIAMFYHPFNKNFHYPALILLSLFLSHIWLCIFGSFNIVMIFSSVEQLLLVGGLIFL